MYRYISTLACILLPFDGLVEISNVQRKIRFSDFLITFLSTF